MVLIIIIIFITGYVLMGEYGDFVEKHVKEGD